jgi:2-iminobutanoate/2-iminopropanoate deaminase
MSAKLIRFGNAPTLANGTRLPYSRAVRMGDTVYVSGQLPLDAAGAIVAGDIGDHTRQAMVNLQATLALAGCTLGDVAKITIWLNDIADFAGFNEAYRGFFDDSFPARSTTGGATLAFGAKVEIEAIALHPGADQG